MKEQELQMLFEMFNEEERYELRCLGDGGRNYNNQQIAFVLRKVSELGIRATARALRMHRRTIQRWCRKFNFPVKRCPEWVYEWAYRRRIKRRGYY